MDIKALQWELAAFVVDRGLDPLHTPKNLSMALASETGTLLALFKWLDDDAPVLGSQAERAAAADALADSVLHAIHLADRLGIDLDEAIRRKLARNAEKYPPAPAGASASASAPAPVATPAPVAAPTPPPAPRAASERRVVPDRRVAPERRFEPERRTGQDRRADRKASSRGPASVMPDLPRPAAPPPPVRETPPTARPAPPPEAPRAAAPPPPPRPARVDPLPPPPPVVEEVDPYAHLDPNEARELVESLSRQVNRARSDDPLARELHDELTTLKRTLYAENPKRAWVAGSLKSIRRILDEARSHSVGAELRAREYLAQVEEILKE